MSFKVAALSVPSAGAPFEATLIERREPRPHDVVIDIAYAGICHSDIHQAREEWGRRLSRWCRAMRSPARSPPSGGRSPASRPVTEWAWGALSAPAASVPAAGREKSSTA